MKRTQEEQIKFEMNRIVEIIESCKTGEQLMKTYDLINNFNSIYEPLKRSKRTKHLYENVQNFINHQKVKINLKMHSQLFENSKL